MIAAIVLAGGRSERMGTQKLAIKLGGKTVLERVVDALNEAQVDSILVVLGPTASGLEGLVRPPAQALVLAEQTRDMRSTLEAAVDHIESEGRMSQNDGLLVCLGDQPTLRSETVRSLLAAYQLDPSRIVVPVFDGRRGHPVLLPWQTLASIRRLPPEQGLNALLRGAVCGVIELPTDDADVLLDLDEPSDLALLSKRCWD